MSLLWRAEIALDKEEIVLRSATPPWDHHWVVTDIFVTNTPTVEMNCEVFVGDIQEDYLLAECKSFPNHARGHELIPSNTALAFALSEINVDAGLRFRASVRGDLVKGHVS